MEERIRLTPFPQQEIRCIRSQNAPKAGCGLFHTLNQTTCFMKKRAIFTILSLCSALLSFAQGNGMAGISEATNMVTSYFDPLTKLIFAVAAILGLVGGVRVYSKFSSGDPDASKSATALFLSCVFLVIVGTVLRSFFL